MYIHQEDSQYALGRTNLPSLKLAASMDLMHTSQKELQSLISMFSTFQCYPGLPNWPMNSGTCKIGGREQQWWGATLLRRWWSDAWPKNFAAAYLATPKFSLKPRNDMKLWQNEVLWTSPVKIKEQLLSWILGDCYSCAMVRAWNSGTRKDPDRGWAAQIDDGLVWPGMDWWIWMDLRLIAKMALQNHQFLDQRHLPRTSGLRSQVLEVEIQKNCHGAALLSIAQVYDAWCVWPGNMIHGSTVRWLVRLWQMLWRS